MATRKASAARTAKAKTSVKKAPAKAPAKKTAAKASAKTATAKPAKKAPASKPAKKAPAAKPPKKAPAGKTAGGDSVFAALRAILSPHAKSLVVTKDDDVWYYLDTKTHGPNGKPLFFGAVRAGKAYTSYYLMPVYVFPELLASASPALKKRMQGKSCFNFQEADPALFAELSQLTARGLARFRDDGKLG